MNIFETVKKSLGSLAGEIIKWKRSYHRDDY